MDPAALARKRVVRLTTRGRRSGASRTVTIWFVPSAANGIYVQHSSPRPAHWYRNLVAEPRVELDFGDGPRRGRARPISDPGQVREVLRLVRRKYPLAWVFQLLGWGRKAAAAEITFEE
jgi:deazaflavin-dependent oxidoreductase (nitroreductase family)